MEVDSDSIEDYIELSDSDESESVMQSKAESKTKKEIEQYCHSIMDQEVG
jgi:hypothetical protein